MTALPKNDKNIDILRQKVLRWYDAHRRSLPWRALPGQTPNPYHVWLSEIMLQQTVVNAVIPYFLKFTEQWPTVHDLAAAPQDDVMHAWAGLGYYARARNLHKCARIVSEEHGGTFPNTIEELKKLPGIGDYTAAAIAAIAFDKPATVIDGNIERVVSRYYAIEQPLPKGKKDIKAKTELWCENRTDHPGDFAQALMDIGAGVCIPKAPRCGLCPLQSGCTAYKAGTPETFPRRQPKKQKPQKHGYIYWITDPDGNLLAQKRPEKGMLGSMTGLPTSEWLPADEKPTHPDFLKPLSPKPLDESISHSFTHFDLKLSGHLITLPDTQSMLFPDDFFWIAKKDILKTGWPTLFKKFVKLLEA